MCKIYASNFTNGAIDATLEDFDDLAEKSEISYKEAAQVG
jgi:hypothetical protein